MRLAQLLTNVPLETICADLTTEITAIVSDSRRAVPGSLFLCLRGTRTDGHRYIADAMARGAVAVVVEASARPYEVPFVAVHDTRHAAAHIWNTYYGDPTAGMRVAAITGTNGKTSTAWFLRAILREAGYKVGLMGTVRCECGDEILPFTGGGEISDVPSAMTTPDPEYLYGTAADMRARGAEILVLEASSHALSQKKLDPVRVDCGVFTNLSPEHLDYHGTMDAYLAAKSHLFSLSACGIVPAGNPAADQIRASHPSVPFRRFAVGREGEAEVRALRYRSLGMDGVAYLYHSERTVFPICCPVPGGFTAANTLAAAAAAWELGVDAPTIQEALRSFTGVSGRMERIELPGAPFALFVDYAHTPVALEMLLRTVRESRKADQKIVLLFGCGGDRDPAKRPVMGQIATALADLTIVTADNSRSEPTEGIIAQILRGINREKPYIVIPDRREAIAYAIDNACPRDILLFVGKGHEKYEICRDGMHPFDEAEIAREYYMKKKRKI